MDFFSFKKIVVHDSTCELCGAEPETTSHLILHCPLASNFWNLTFPRIAPFYETLVLLATLETQEAMTLRRTLQVCKHEASAWSCRLPLGKRTLGDHWCSLFSLAM